MTTAEIAASAVEFVLNDRRYRQLRLRGSIVEVFRRAKGIAPTSEQIMEVLRLFWIEFDRHCPDIRQTPPVGGGSPYYVMEDLSPWQENAIRALEEEGDANH